MNTNSENTVQYKHDRRNVIMYSVLHTSRVSEPKIPFMSPSKDECIKYIMEHINPYYSEQYRILETEYSSEKDINYNSRSFKEKVKYNIVCSFYVLINKSSLEKESIDPRDCIIYAQSPSYTNLDSDLVSLEMELNSQNLRAMNLTGIRGYVTLSIDSIRSKHVNYLKNAVYDEIKNKISDYVANEFKRMIDNNRSFINVSENFDKSITDIVGIN